MTEAKRFIFVFLLSPLGIYVGLFLTIILLITTGNANYEDLVKLVRIIPDFLVNIYSYCWAALLVYGLPVYLLLKDIGKENSLLLIPFWVLGGTSLYYIKTVVFNINETSIFPEIFTYALYGFFISLFAWQILNRFSLPKKKALQAEMESFNNQTLNPWVSMWTKPRTTIQQIVDTNPDHLVFLLTVIYGFGRLLVITDETGLVGSDVELQMIFVHAVILGPSVGIIFLYISCVFLRCTGSWINGKASSQDIRSALAWSSVPHIWALLLWIPIIAIFCINQMSIKTTFDANPSLSFIFPGMLAIQIGVNIWSFVVFLKCLGQVQGFSAWKALGNLILSGLVIIIPIVMIMALI